MSILNSKALLVRTEFIKLSSKQLKRNLNLNALPKYKTQKQKITVVFIKSDMNYVSRIVNGCIFTSLFFTRHDQIFQIIKSFNNYSGTWFWDMSQAWSIEFMQTSLFDFEVLIHGFAMMRSGIIVMKIAKCNSFQSMCIIDIQITTATVRTRLKLNSKLDRSIFEVILTVQALIITIQTILENLLVGRQGKGQYTM